MTTKLGSGSSSKSGDIGSRFDEALGRKHTFDELEAAAFGYLSDGRSMGAPGDAGAAIDQAGVELKQRRPGPDLAVGVGRREHAAAQEFSGLSLERALEYLPADHRR